MLKYTNLGNLFNTFDTGFNPASRVSIEQSNIIIYMSVKGVKVT